MTIGELKEKIAFLDDDLDVVKINRNSTLSPILNADLIEFKSTANQLTSELYFAFSFDKDEEEYIYQK